MYFFPHYSFLLFSIFSLLLPCLCRAGFNREDFQSETRVMELELFQKWKETHGKTYKHVDEEVNRLENFKKNMKYIEQVNLNRAGYRVGLNRFGDISNEEFWAGLSQWNHERGGSSFKCDEPLSLDWRKKGVVTAVKDQGVSGCSWKHSLIGAIEGINAIHTEEFSILSEQELNVMNNGGIGNEVSIPKTEGDDATKMINKLVDIDALGYVEQTETALLCATVNQPISVGIDGSSIDFQLYTGGIYDGPCSSDPVDINHAVLIVGYGSEGDDDYWIVKNSWGTTWGMDGYIYIRRNTNLPYGVCAINAVVSYPLPTTLAASPASAPSSVSPPPYDPPPQPSSSPPSPTPSYPTPPPLLPSPPPTPIPTPSYNPPTPSPPAPSQPPPPPSPPPSHKCGLLSFCLPGQTCCCLYESFGFCLIQGCCDYTNAVCCHESDYCCPLEYPICDINAGLCLKNYDDNLGLDLKKKTWAKFTLPWSEYEENREISYESLKWRRYGSAKVKRL